MGFILFFIVRYASEKADDSYENGIIAFEKMTVTTNQIIANYLEDEQHLCDILANYVNFSAQEGAPMTDDEAISFIRRAKTTPEIQAHLIFLDSPKRAGISTTAKVSDPDVYDVSYKNINIFDNIESAGKRPYGEPVHRLAAPWYSFSWILSSFDIQFRCHDDLQPRAVRGSAAGQSGQ